jgi:hypothetical protein
MRFAFVSTLFLIAAAALRASSIGVTANGTCVAGNCPAVTIPFSTSDSVSVNSTLTLADGDRYLIYGSFSGSNGSGTFSTNHDFEVIYEGNARGGASAADTITVDALYSFQGSGTDTFYRDVIGEFASTIAASSSASSCVNATLGCIGPVTPPGSFGPTTSFPLTGSGGAFTFDPSFVNNFGAGSAVGSYIVWGQTTELPAPSVPEPASLPLLGFASIFLAVLLPQGSKLSLQDEVKNQRNGYHRDSRQDDN